MYVILYARFKLKTYYFRAVISDYNCVDIIYLEIHLDIGLDEEFFLVFGWNAHFYLKYQYNYSLNC